MTLKDDFRGDFSVLRKTIEKKDFQDHPNLLLISLTNHNKQYISLFSGNLIPIMPSNPIANYKIYISIFMGFIWIFIDFLFE